jgi:hypothetical protein
MFELTLANKARNRQTLRVRLCQVLHFGMLLPWLQTSEQPETDKHYYLFGEEKRFYNFEAYLFFS